MNVHRQPAIGLAAATILGSCLLPIWDGSEVGFWIDAPLAAALTAVQLIALLILVFFGPVRVTPAVLLVAVVSGSAAQYFLLEAEFVFGVGGWLALVATMLCLWRLLAWLSAHPGRTVQILVPALFFFGWVLCWEIAVRGAQISPVLLPAPSGVLNAFVAHFPILWSDALQTLFRSALRGYAMGCTCGFGLAILFDRFPVIGRAFMPYCTALSAVPMVGLAPIMVMWFGFGWESKAAVVCMVTFFPMLINTSAGLATPDGIQRDLMRSYNASYGTELFMLKLPSAVPLIVTALKLNSTLAIISAIVAEFFGTPVFGMGFRISVELARMNLDLVWATIVMGALVGTLVYGGISLAERVTTSRNPTAQ